MNSFALALLICIHLSHLYYTAYQSNVMFILSNTKKYYKNQHKYSALPKRIYLGYYATYTSYYNRQSEMRFLGNVEYIASGMSRMSLLDLAVSLHLIISRWNHSPCTLLTAMRFRGKGLNMGVEKRILTDIQHHIFSKACNNYSMPPC